MNREKIKKAKRIVIKIGTSSLILPNGHLNLKNIDDLAFTLSSLQHEGYEMILVTSGAVGVGLNVLEMVKRPTDMAQQQALAAVGQVELMSLYNQLFSRYQQKVSQLLLTRDVVDFPESRKNATNAINALLSLDIIPIINENDAVSVEEMAHRTKFGDNDKLGALVTVLTDADLLIMLSDIEGLYDKNPNIFDDAKLIENVTEITETIMKTAGGAGSRFGTGGMTSKLEAAKIIFDADKQMVLTNGARIREIRDVIDGKKRGTYFEKSENKKRIL
ncbi:glutamate 5-kinase [Lactococcus hodotermopsidis]|uniref:Glutamate 5-kinase n=1 Tax=Pseudolactococcus hodotermopsidis TaxID=2709157 RepID=A0A6A0BBF0_9LACT|nr:glutamate 5-kinase [Lactococcus hodotermopsidis]GFH41714.1 glutamate 5-kinase [Lactococcus hodotermopsidis]